MMPQDLFWAVVGRVPTRAARLVAWGGRPGYDIQIGSASDRRREAYLRRAWERRMAWERSLAAMQRSVTAFRVNIRVGMGQFTKATRAIEQMQESMRRVERAQRRR